MVLPVFRFKAKQVTLDRVTRAFKVVSDALDELTNGRFSKDTLITKLTAPATRPADATLRAEKQHQTYGYVLPDGMLHMFEVCRRERLVFYSVGSGVGNDLATAAFLSISFGGIELNEDYFNVQTKLFETMGFGNNRKFNCRTTPSH
eukprot:SAG11_NODE_6260_length_1349_cov_3.372000_1_plen_147_part_00